VAELAHADTCVAPVLSVPELVEEPQFLARRAFAVAKHPEHGAFRQVGATLAGMNPVADDREVRDPTLTDTDELLAAAGYSATEVAALRATGVAA
jgi:alpha-methylacyl-CoA racemase